MNFSPTGVLYFCHDIPFDSTYAHSMDFTDPTAQMAWFSTVETLNLTEYTYIRKDNSIKVNMNVETLMSLNYVVYRNGSTDKWIYAFVTDKRYINEGTTEVYIETDIFQTFMFNYTWHETFIEREHQDRWTGVNYPIYSVTDEGLTLGDEYVKELTTTVAYGEEYFLVVASQQLEEIDTYLPPTMVQGALPTPLYYYVIGGSQKACIMLSDEPAIISISLIPFITYDYDLLDDVNYINIEHNTNIIIKRIKSAVSVRKILGTINRYVGMDLPTSFSMYNVRHYKYESKLLSYPYAYTTLTNYQGKPMIIKNEYVTGQNLEVTLVQNVSHEIKSKYFISSGYKGETTGKDNCLMIQNVNDLPLVTDEYRNYMQQHKASIVTGMAVNATSGALGAVGAMASGNVLGAVASMGNAVAQIAGEIAKQKDLQTVPDSVRGLGNNIAFDLADNNLGLVLCQHAVDVRIKKVLGDYFALYGYKCQEVKVPNLRSRHFYNYIKTIGCNIDGSMDNNDLEKLKSIFDKGITIWHDRDFVIPLRYGYDNVEVSLNTL